MHTNEARAPESAAGRHLAVLSPRRRHVADVVAIVAALVTLVGGLALVAPWESLQASQSATTAWDRVLTPRAIATLHVLVVIVSAFVAAAVAQRVVLGMYGFKAWQIEWPEIVSANEQHYAAVTRDIDRLRAELTEAVDGLAEVVDGMYADLYGEDDPVEGTMSESLRQ